MLTLTPTHANTHTNLSALDAKLLLKEPLSIQELPHKGLSTRYITILNNEQWQSLNQIFIYSVYITYWREILKWYKAFQSDLSICSMDFPRLLQTDS